MAHVARRTAEDEIRRVERVRHPTTQLGFDVAVWHGEMIYLPPLARLSGEFFVAVVASTTTFIVYQFFQRLAIFSESCFSKDVKK